MINVVAIMQIFWVTIIQNLYSTAHHSYVFRVIYNSIQIYR